MNINGFDERRCAAYGVDPSLQLLLHLRSKLVAHGSNNLPADTLEIVDNLIAMQEERSPKERKASAMVQYDICLEVCSFLSRVVLDQAYASCRLFRNVIEGNEATTLSLRRINYVDISLNFGVAMFSGGYNFTVSSSIRCQANESGVTNVVEYAADDLTSVFTTIAPFLRTSFCNTVSMKFSHNQLQSDLEFDAGPVKQTFASMSKGVVVRSLSVWMRTATPGRVTDVLCLFDSVKQLSVSWARTSPAYIDQEVFSHCWQKGVRQLEFFGYPKPDPSPANAMQLSDIIAFCCTQPHTGEHRAVTAFYADTSNLFDVILQLVVSENKKKKIGSLNGDAELEFTLIDVRLPDVEHLEQRLRELCGVEQPPYIINNLANRLLLVISTRERLGFGASPNVTVRINNNL